MGLRDCDGDDSSNKKDLENMLNFVASQRGVNFQIAVSSLKLGKIINAPNH
jgi:hypothetical protein